LDKSDNSEEIADENDENETTNSLTKFSDLQYILNQKPIPQRQFEKFDPFFTPEGFLCSEVLINIRKNHDAFSRHSKRISNNQTSITGSLNLNNANRLITEFTNNSTQENRVNKRKDRWKGRKRLAAIPISAGINGTVYLLAL
jgi:hypothetical protein